MPFSDNNSSNLVATTPQLIQRGNHMEDPRSQQKQHEFSDSDSLLKCFNNYISSSGSKDQNKDDSDNLSQDLSDNKTDSYHTPKRRRLRDVVASELTNDDFQISEPNKKLNRSETTTIEIPMSAKKEVQQMLRERAINKFFARVQCDHSPSRSSSLQSLSPQPCPINRSPFKTPSSQKSESVERFVPSAYPNLDHCLKTPKLQRSIKESDYDLNIVSRIIESGPKTPNLRARENRRRSLSLAQDRSR